MAVLHTREWGRAAGEPIVCLHGISAHGGRFETLASQFPDHRVVAMDLRAHGQSTWDAPWNLQTHVADVLETCDALGIEMATWIGHSFSGRIVIEIGARFAGRVQRQVLLDPVLRLDPTEVAQMVRTVNPDLSYASPEAAVEAKLTDGSLRFASRADVEADAQVHLRQGQDDQWRWQFVPQAMIVAMSELAAEPPPFGETPTLVVLGADSWVTFDLPVSQAVEMLTVPGGHVVLWDAPLETSEAVVRFISAAPQRVG